MTEYFPIILANECQECHGEGHDAGVTCISCEGKGIHLTENGKTIIRLVEKMKS